MDSYLLQRLLGDAAHSQREPQVIQTSLHALLPHKSCCRRDGPVGLPPCKRPVTCCSHRPFHKLLQDPVWGWVLDLDSRPAVCVSSNPHGSRRGDRREGRHRSLPLLSAFPDVLHEALLYQRFLTKYLGLDLGSGAVRRMQHAVEGARSDCSGHFSSVRYLCIASAENASVHSCFIQGESPFLSCKLFLRQQSLLNRC